MSVHIHKNAAARLQRIKNHPRVTKRNLLFVLSAGVIYLAITASVAFYWPRSVTFSFGGNSCFTNPVLMPKLVTQSEGHTYDAVAKTSFTLGNYPVYSHSTCLTAAKAPKAHTQEMITFGSLFAHKTIPVATPAYPAVSGELEKPVSTADPLVFNLDSGDKVFRYLLSANNKKTECITQDQQVRCPTTALDLVQSQRYEFKLDRLFKDQSVDALFTRTLRTVENVRITDSSINKNQIIYNVPKSLELTLHRSAVTAQSVKLVRLDGKKQHNVPVETEVKGKKVIIRFKEDLPREASLRLRIRRVLAADGGFTAKPFILPFKTSGGPKVLGVSIGTYKAPTSGTIVMTFDAPIDTKQNIQKYVRLSSGGKTVSSTVYAAGNSIAVTMKATLPRCTPFTLQIFNGLKNKYGISGGSAWQYRSRTICQNVFSIGSSVLGRSITAYRFGNGPSKIVFVGATHGDEVSSASILMQLIDSIEARGSVPGRRSIIIIPVLNPDGYAAGRRTNARNVDLNRNFPANNWKSSVRMPDGTTNKKGGGSAPLSEPESRAIANYISSNRPRLVLTYHAVAGVVIPNGSGDSGALARAYDQRSNVGYASNGESESLFQYDTTGAMEDWMRDKLGLPALLIELWTDAGYEFGGHSNAMWHMIGL